MQILEQMQEITTVKIDLLEDVVLRTGVSGKKHTELLDSFMGNRLHLLLGKVWNNLHKSSNVDFKSREVFELVLKKGKAHSMGGRTYMDGGSLSGQTAWRFISVTEVGSCMRRAVDNYN